MAEIGKISGPLLEDNLQRSGVDLAFDTDLLYLDVANRRIGISNIAPVATVNASNVLSNNLQVDTQLTVGNMNFYTNTIQYPIGNLVLQSNNIVYAPNWKTTGGLNLGGSTISATVGDQDINIQPTGTGRVNVNSDMMVYGNLHATGDITFDGNMTFGDSDTDSVNIKADIASDIRPDVTDTYSLGVSGKSWLNTYSKNVYANSIVSNNSYTINNIEVTLRQGKSWYVSINGSDTNVGDHQNGPFLTLSKALSVATSGDTINIYPGTYQETCPMTVPVGVTVKGLDIRTVIISPTPATRNKDVFLVNGEVTIEDLTITGFEYDSVNNTGYAFKFANNFTVSSRSPYVKNISVITQGSTVRLGTAPSDDPRGFLAGDAGRGAYIDGALANSASKEASLLFHSCTFICPNTDCIVMTNGVRVEWLNCFTYFANIGLKATNGTAGFANLGVKFGAEIRSINSASIYGNFGASADGNKTLMYLIGHNFAYVGSGRFGNNDPTLAIENNQALMSNDGKIYYQSTDQSGNVRVGSVFKINGETGAVNFVSNGLTLGGSSSITFSSGIHSTYLDPRVVRQDNLTFNGLTNEIQSSLGNIIFTPQSGVIDLNTNTFTIPKGNDVSLTLSNPGEIRFNVDNNHFEGYAASGLLNLYSIEDSTRTTRITPELTPGANDKTIRMYINNVLKASINATSTTFQNLYVGNLKFNQPSLVIDPNQTLSLTSTGTGLVNIKTFSIQDDLITNTSLDQNITFDSADGSYVRIPGTGAFVTPTGLTSERPNSPEVGMQRYNLELQYLEVWDGTAWVNASGTTAVSEQDMTEIADFWALILG